MKKLALLALLLPGLALAHVGGDAGAHHGSAFLAGLTHPFTGLDHMAAMVAVGLWSALALRRSWAMPLVFATLLLAGGLLGMVGVNLPAVEPMIAASLLVLGLLVATRVRLAALLGASLVGAFAVFHGLAHGAELPAAQAAAALSGMTLGTVSLHLIGMGLGHGLRGRNVWLGRVLGGGIALFGTALLSGAL